MQAWQDRFRDPGLTVLLVVRDAGTRRPSPLTCERALLLAGITPNAATPYPSALRRSSPALPGGCPGSVLLSTARLRCLSPAVPSRYARTVSGRGTGSR